MMADLAQIQDELFPISESEASALHDMGWSSGYGWRDQWDWWRSNVESHNGVERAMDSRDTDQTKFEMYRYVMAIRKARHEADQILKAYMSAQPTIDWTV